MPFVIVYWGNDNDNPDVMLTLFDTHNDAVEHIVQHHQEVYCDTYMDADKEERKEALEMLISEQQDLYRDIKGVKTEEEYWTWLGNLAQEYFSDFDPYHEQEVFAEGWKYRINEVTSTK